MEGQINVIKNLKDIYQQTANKKKAGYADKGTIHSYIDNYYEPTFNQYRSMAKQVLEIGINRGHSINMWKEYFYNASIIGVDILDRGAICPSCTLIYGDATEEKTFENIYNIDIIIDDGSHKLEHQLKSFEILFPKLKEGGIYVIEDIEDIDSSRDLFMNLHPNVQIFDFRKIKNRSDDVIIEIKK